MEKEYLILRPERYKCDICGEPIYAEAKNAEGDPHYLMDNGTVIHRRPECVFQFLDEKYLMR